MEVHSNKARGDRNKLINIANMNNKFFKQIPQFLNKFLETKDKTLFCFDRTYVRSGRIYKINMLGC